MENNSTVLESAEAIFEFIMAQNYPMGVTLEPHIDRGKDFEYKLSELDRLNYMMNHAGYGLQQLSMQGKTLFIWHRMR